MMSSANRPAARDGAGAAQNAAQVSAVNFGAVCVCVMTDRVPRCGGVLNYP
jgi:hypothetical protein